MKYLASILILLLGQYGYAQGSSKDSLISLAINAVYNDPNRALEIGLSLLENSETGDEKLEIINLLISANAATRNFDNIVKYANLADELAQTSKNHGLKVQTFNNLGAQYHSLKLFGKAISYLDKAKEEIATKLEGEEKQQALGFNNIVRAFVYRDQMGCAIALPLLDESISNYSSVSHLTSSKQNLSTAHYNKGNCLMAIGDLNAAITQFEISSAYADTSQAPSLMAFSQKGLAQAYTSSGHFEASLEVLYSAEKNAEQIGDPLLSQAIYMSMANNYLALSDLDAANDAKEKSRLIQNEIIRNANHSVLELLHTAGSLHGQQMNTSRKKHHVLMALLIVGFVVASIIIVWIYRRQKSMTHELDKALADLASPTEEIQVT